MTSKPNKFRERSYREYLSPFGVISISEFFARVFAFVAMLFIIPFVSMLVYFQFENSVNESSQVISIFLFILLLCTPSILGVWFLLATVTKLHRTNGMSMPFIFALLTPILPFFYIFRFIFTSKEKKQVNQALAIEQLAFRKAQKEAEAIPEYLR